MLFLHRLRETCREHASKTAVDFRRPASSERLSFGELHAGTTRTAAWLAGKGACAGDRVAICLPKSVASIQLHLAACSVGAVSMPVNPDYSQAELNYLLRDSRAKLLVTTQGRSGGMGPVARFPDSETRVAEIDPHRFGRDLPPRGPDLASIPIAADQTALMLYTSGTTGRPKGACMSHASLTANMDMLCEAWKWSADDVLLHALPLFHVHGLLVALHGALYAGATSVVLSSFDAQQVVRGLAGGECTVFMAVPTMYRRILSLLGDDVMDLRHMRLLTSGSDRLPVEAFQRIERQMGMRVVERYGMTETGIMLSNPVDGERIAGQVGVPLPGVGMRIRDPETGAPAGQGEVGELQTQGPHVFTGYWRDPEKTERSFTDDGWFRTGDLGLCDKKGRYELKGRSTDLIISGGFNVYPSEVEHTLAAHPDVGQCAVVGLPDPDWGEAVTAFVVSKSPDPCESRLIGHCRQSLAGYKTPKRVVFLESLPRNAMGKVQKQLLRGPAGQGTGG